jgi:hypothetical protein
MTTRITICLALSLTAAATGCSQQPGGSTASNTNNDNAAGTSTSTTTVTGGRAATPVASDTPSSSSSPRATSAPGNAAPSSVAFELQSSGLPHEGMWKCDPVTGDFNEDGFIDLAVLPRLGNGTAVFLGAADGSWTESSEGLFHGDRSCGGGLAVADLNNDGHLDLAVGDHCNGIFTFLGDGKGNWSLAASEVFPKELAPEPQREALYTGVEDIDVGDVNGDGHLDIVAGSADEGGLNVFLGDSTALDWFRDPASNLPTIGWALRVLLHDLDGDGDLDLLASHSDGPRAFINDGKGRFAWSSGGLPTPRMQGIFHGLAVADFNKDGLPDFAVANWIDGPECYLQNPDHSWSKTADVFPQMLGGAVALTAGDLNADGLPDILCAGRLNPDPGYVRGVFLLLNNSALPASFTFVENSGLPSTGLATTSGLALADLNGDGLPDALAGSGLIVESSDRPDALKSPVIAERIIVWRSKPTSATGDGTQPGQPVSADASWPRLDARAEPGSSSPASRGIQSEQGGEPEVLTQLFATYSNQMHFVPEGSTSDSLPEGEVLRE